MLRGALFGLAVFCAATPALADPLDDVIAAHSGFSGAVLVARDGAILFDKAYGLADAERGIANRTSTSFHLGTLSMGFTDLAMLHLVNTRKLSLANTAGQFLPDLAPPTRDLRIGDLVDDNGPDAPARHVLLARIAAAAMNKPFVDGAGSYVFASVWQNGMGWDDGSLGTDSRYAKGYGAGGRPVTPDWPSVLGADGAYSTTRDLMHWVGQFYDDRLMLLEPLPTLPAAMRAGFGWNPGQGDFYKAGAGSGFTAAIRVVPESRLTVIVLSNHAGAPAAEIAAALEHAAAPRDPADKRKSIEYMGFSTLKITR